MTREAYEPPALELIAPSEDIRAEFNHYSVLDPSGTTVGGGDVVEQPDKPSSWWNDPSNWGGD